MLYQRKCQRIVGRSNKEWTTTNVDHVYQIVCRCLDISTLTWRRIVDLISELDMPGIPLRSL